MLKEIEGENMIRFEMKMALETERSSINIEKRSEIWSVSTQEAVEK